jgi:hypothetical protein
MSEITRFMISIGQGEPAMMPVRSEERLNSLNMGWFSSAHGRDTVERRAPLLLHGGQGQERVEALQDDGCGSVRVRRHDPEHQAEAMEQRHGQTEPIGLGEFLPLADVEAVVQDVVVGEHHALGEARGARGVLHVDDLVAGEARRGPGQLLVAGVAAEQEQLLGVVHPPVFLRPDEDDALEPGEASALEPAALAGLQLGYQLVDDGHIVDVAEAVDETEGFDIRLLHQVLQLVEPVGGVHRNRDDPDLGCGEEEGEPVGHVGGPDAEVVTLLEADGEQALGEAVHPAIEFRVGKAQIPVGVDHELLVGMPGDLALQDLSERLGDVLHRLSSRNQAGAYTTARIWAGRSPAQCTLWATMLS